MAILLRLRKILLRLSQPRKDHLHQSKLERHSPQFRKPITVQELEDAETAIVRQVKTQAFSTEIDILERIKKSGNQNERSRERRKKNEIKKKSSIYRISPILQHGVLSVGERLCRGNLPEQMKHPFVLPNKSHVTTITRANSTVRHVLYQCVTCKRLKASPTVQRMADLPQERLTVAPPFTYI